MILNLPAALNNLDKVIERVGRDAILIGIGTFDQKFGQLLLLRRIELARAARFAAVEEALQPFCVVALDGVAQRLPLHARCPRRRVDRHPAQNMRDPQHAAARPIVFLRPREPQERFHAVEIASHFRLAPHDALRINDRLALHESRKNADGNPFESVHLWIGISHPEVCSLDLAGQRASVAGHQAPWATVIGCADSRTPPELIFGGHGVGELFVARNAGNLVDTATLGTVEYGAAVLGSPLIVVLAHTACGAVKAACDVVTKNATYPGAIGPMIEPIVPAALAARSEEGDYVTNTAKKSAARTAGRLTTASTLISGLGGRGQAQDRASDL